MGFEVIAVNNYNLELPKAFILLIALVNFLTLVGDRSTGCFTVSSITLSPMISEIFVKEPY